MVWMTIVFFLSGLSALVYQLLWMRHLGFVFGNTVYASATVLTAFMAGLALGAQVLGRIGDRLRRPVLWFGVFELAVAGIALLMPLMFGALQGAYVWVYQNVSSSLLVLTPLRFAMGFTILIVPTFLMGGTLPLLVGGLAREEKGFGRRMSWLYGVNTLGALAGVLVCGFYLIPAVGLSQTNRIAALTDFLAGVGAIAWVMTVRSKPVDGTQGRHVENRRLRWRSLTLDGRAALIMTAICGFVVLALEVVWFRALILVYGSTTYSFTTMLAVFLGGIALGSMITTPWLDRWKQTIVMMAVCLVGLGGWSLWSMYSYDRNPEFLLRVLARRGFSWEAMNLARFTIAISHLLVPALFSGAAFACGARILRRENLCSARATGVVYAVNTWGAVIGSFVGGFVFLPLIGIEKSLQCLGLLCFFTGLAAAVRFSEKRGLKAVGVLAGICVVVVLTFIPPKWSRELLSAGAYFSPFNFVRDGELTLRESILSHRLLLYGEGLTCTVSVQRSDDEKMVFSMDGKVEADESTRGMVVQRMIGHLPMLFHPNPRRVVNVGLGAGVSFGALSVHDPDRLEVVEIEPRVQEATRLWGHLNHNVLDNPNATVIINDGRNHLLCTTNEYDVISADPFEPVVGGASHLFTVDYFRQARARLAEGGIMCQWVPMYEMSKEDYLMIVRSFMHVFPESALFYTGFDTLLLGFRDEMMLDPEVLQARFARPAVSNSLASVGFSRPEMILGMFVADLRQRASFTGTGQLNTDDHPHIEFNVPRSAMRYTTEANQQALLDCFTEIPTEWLDKLSPEVAMKVSREHEAVRLTLEAGVLRTQGRTEDAFMKLAEARAISPDNPVVINEMVGMLVHSAATLRQQNMLADAAEQFQLALQLQPNEFWALHNMVEMYVQAGQMEAARRLLDHALSHYPDAPLMRLAEGKMIFSGGEQHGGFELVRALAMANPSNVRIWSALHQMAISLSDFKGVEEARKQLTRIAEYLQAKSRVPPSAPAPVR